MLSLVTAISYVSGIFMIVRSLIMFKSFGQHANMMGQRGETLPPLVLLFVGAALIYLPGTLGASFTTFFANGGMQTDSVAVTVSETSSMIAYAQSQGNPNINTAMDVLLGYTKLIGLIAFVRGWHIIAHIGGQGAQPGNATKGLVHIIGGVLAMNVLEFINVLASTMGYSPLF